MAEHNQQALKDRIPREEVVRELKTIQPLKGFDFAASDGFVCDMETGICGPVNQEKETKL